MKDEELNIGIKEIKKISMTSAEKRQIFERILNSQNFEERPVIRSPWIYSVGLFIQRNKVFSYSTFVLLFVILGSGGFVSASQRSLPGNALYPLKVNWVEPFRSALKLYPEEKAQYESSLATKRLVEAETLAREDKLDASKEKQINDLLTKHTLALNEAINQTEKRASKEKIYRIAVNFQNEMDIHAQILDDTKARIKAQTEKKIEKKEIPREIEKEQEKNKVIQKEIQKEKQVSEDLESIKEPPVAKSQTGFTANMAPATNSVMIPNTTKEEEEIIKKTTEKIIEREKEQKEFENIEEDEHENLISKNARANAKKIKDTLERKRTEKKYNYKEKEDRD